MRYLSLILLILNVPWLIRPDWIDAPFWLKPILVNIEDSFLFMLYSCRFVSLDYKTGFGGKFGVQSDRVDKSALSWDHHEQLNKHESQVKKASLG